MFGLAEHVWQPERARWVLRPKLKRIFTIFSVILVALYFLVAWLKYAENKWIRGCNETSYPEICLFIFPDKIPGTKQIWVPGFIHRRIEAARESHRAKLADMLLAKAKDDLKERQWSKFFQNIFGATKLNPQNKEARLIASQALFALRRDDDAMESLEDALPQLLSNREFVREYIVTSFIKERFARLLGVCKFHLANPTIPQEAREAFLLAAAHCHYERGEYAQCAEIIGNPMIARTRDAFMLRVKMLRETGKIGDAITLLSTASAQNPNDADIISQLINMRKEAGDVSGARESASLQLILSDSPMARLRMLDLLDADADKARIDDIIASYRRDYGKNTDAMLHLCEFAASTGRSELCEALRREAEAAQSINAQRMRLLQIESHLAHKRYLETVRMVDELFVENPEWLANSRLQFDCLRMVAHFALKREDTGEIGYKRINETMENLQPQFMQIVARRLIEAGRNTEAIRVIELCNERNRSSVSSLAALVNIHLEAGGTTDTTSRLREFLKHRRPARKTLLDARRVLGGDAYFFDPLRDDLIRDIEALLEGRSILSEVKPIAPKKPL